MSGAGLRPPSAAELESPDPLVRRSAALALAESAGAEPEARLMGFVGDPDYRVREATIAVLARRYSSRVGEACRKLIREGRSPLARTAAAGILARAGEGGRPLLLECLSSDSAEVRRTAVRALPGPPADRPVVGALEAAMRLERDCGVRAELIAALGRSKRAEAVSCLLLELEGGSFWLAAHAAVALGEIGVPAVAPRLLALLPDASLRDAALAALSELRNPAVGEELARRAAAGETDPRLLSSLRLAAETAPSETVGRLTRLWPGAPADLRARLIDENGPVGGRRDAALLISRLDIPDAAAALVDAGTSLGTFEGLRHLPPSRYQDAVAAVLRTTDPEAAFTVLEVPAAPGERGALAILLSHPWPSVRAATLGRLPAGAAPLSDLVGLLAEERTETSLAAAFSLAAEARGSEPGRARACRSALLDRAQGPDGPGRASAVRALGRSDEPRTASALSRAIASSDPGVRAAGAAAAAFQRGVRDEDLRALLRDDEPDVRAAALRSLTRRAERRGGTVSLERRDLLPLLADEPGVAAAAAAALVAAAGAARPRIVREMLAERGPVRRGAIEEIPATRDRQAAEAVIPAAMHEDSETARLVIRAMAVARPEIAERVLVEGLRARRPDVRAAAAAAILERPAPVDSDGDLAEALAEALDHESDDEVLEELFTAVPVNGGRRCLEAVLRRLASREPTRGSDAAIEALAQRFPEDLRRAWESAPPRLAARLAHALAVASGARPHAAKATGLPARVCRLFGDLVRRRTGLASGAASQRRLELRLWAEARAAGSFPRLFAVLRESPTESPLFGRLLDAVAPRGRGFRPRDAGHQALADEILPERLLSRGADGTFDVWCVGCGTGEEPHALAMLLLEKGLGAEGRVRIKGSDLSPEALEVAASGTYARHAVAALSAEQRARHFVAAGAGDLRLRDEVRALVRFSPRGLFDEPLGSATYDAIFCRTLLPGLEEDERVRAVESLATFLKPGGYLLLDEKDGRMTAAAPLTLVRLGADIAWRR